MQNLTSYKTLQNKGSWIQYIWVRSGILSKIKMSYKYPQCKDKIIFWPSVLHNGKVLYIIALSWLKHKRHNTNFVNSGAQCHIDNLQCHNDKNVGN